MQKFIFAAAVAGFLATSAHAGLIFYTGGTSDTIYGATNYGGGAQIIPAFIANNLTTPITALNDILSTPGGNYQLANPVIANNVAQLAAGLVPDPNFLVWTGGTNINGFTFGSGATADNGTSIVYGLSDTNAGCCTASYMITSTDSNYVVGPGGYMGTVGAYLTIGGFLPTAADSAVASLVVEYDLNNAGWIQMPYMILAAGGGCNDVAIGGSGAAVVNSACVGGLYHGLSVDNLGPFNLNAGDTIQVISTLTAYADPASIDSIAPDLSLLPDVQLPGFELADTPTPEPVSFGFVGAGLIGLARSSTPDRM